MKRQRLYLLLMLLPLAMTVGCGKEKSHLVEVTQEAYHGGKVALDGLGATWADGEMLLVNASETPILQQDHNGGNYAYIDAEALASTNRALYPTTLSATALVSNNAEIALPRVYHYRTSGGRQQIELPLAAYCTSNEGPLNFKHLTGGIYFTIKNSTGHDLTIDSLTVISSGYSLSGNRTLDFTDIEGHGAVAAATAADRTVALVFDQQATLLANDGECVAFLPIAAVGADNRFTVRASGHYQGRRCTKVQTQTTGGALGRNQMAYAEIAIEDYPTLPLFSGRGTEDKPFLIGSAYEFTLMLEAMSHSEWQDPIYSKAYNNHRYSLTADIDLGGATISSIAAYSGAKFDGGGHIISNATIEGIQQSSTAYCGLFAKIQEACTVSNLSLDRITLRYHGNASTINVGSIVGLFGSNSISNCHASNVSYDIVPTATPSIYLGGIAGHVANPIANITLSNCSYSSSPTLAVATDYFYIGGIVGAADEMGTKSITFTRCQATTAPITTSGNGRRVVGGIVGKPDCITRIQNSSWRSGLNITSASSFCYCGGLVGWLTNSSYTFAYDTVAGSIAATGVSTSYVGAYIGRSTPSVNFPSTCDCSGISSMSVGGVETDKDVGNK